VTRRDGHPVERASSTHSVSPHLSPTEPISDFDSTRKVNDISDAIDGIASRSPYGCSLNVLVSHSNGKILRKVDVAGRGSSETRNGLFNLLTDGQRVRMNDLVVEHDTVERAVDTVVDVV
jgi:hypothetical protein